MTRKSSKGQLELMTRLDETWSLSYVATVGKLGKGGSVFGGAGRGRGRVRGEGGGEKEVHFRRKYETGEGG